MHRQTQAFGAHVKNAIDTGNTGELDRIQKVFKRVDDIMSEHETHKYLFAASEKAEHSFTAPSTDVMYRNNADPDTAMVSLSDDGTDYHHEYDKSRESIKEDRLRSLKTNRLLGRTDSKPIISK
jgi:hypothetical protein